MYCDVVVLGPTLRKSRDSARFATNSSQTAWRMLQVSRESGSCTTPCQMDVAVCRSQSLAQRVYMGAVRRECEGRSRTTWLFAISQPQKMRWASTSFFASAKLGTCILTSRLRVAARGTHRHVPGTNRAHLDPWMQVSWHIGSGEKAKILDGRQ